MSFSARSRSARFRHRASAGLGGAALLALLAGCVPTADAPDSSSRVLQSVHVALTSDGSVRAIDGKAVYLGAESQETTSTETSYRAEEVVDDLPVRVITQYRTDKGSGSDLSDLKGYTGRLELSVAVENLTVAPRSVSYDVTGSQRTSPAPPAMASRR
ncbi:hypothetical protein [Leifsonia xyli]|uniref:hypothetical protein n=1 Tax=Leifsonia xyli TaxID=1575 RepID=UPI00059F151D|nr:hypothetical protein [Leifsonia xyli]